MDRLVGLLGSMSLGAGLMFMLDPDRGRRRRALVRNQAVALNRRLGETASATLEDAGNRARGVVAEARRIVHAVGGEERRHVGRSDAEALGDRAR